MTPWTAAHQASLSFSISQSLVKLISIELTMPSNHLILCRPLLLPSIFPSIRVFFNELALCIRCPNYWSFSFSINPPNEYSGWPVSRLPCPWGFSRQEYYSGLPCPPPGDLPNPGIKHRFPTLQSDSLPSELPGKPKNTGVGRSRSTSSNRSWNSGLVPNWERSTSRLYIVTLFI